MKFKQKLGQLKQTITGGSQSPALKQQELFTTSTAPLQGNTRLETVGQTHTRNCIKCSVELKSGVNWTLGNVKKKFYICRSCIKKRNVISNPIYNAAQMYVEGKYIPTSHPLHKPGRYKSFEHAAFESLKNYSAAKEGQVYILYSPAYPSWCKIGMAVDARDRLKNFQTGTPYRDYILVAAYDVPDRREAEKEAHNLLRETHASKNEWFVIGANVAKEILDGHFNEDN